MFHGKHRTWYRSEPVSAERLSDLDSGQSGRGVWVGFGEGAASPATRLSALLEHRRFLVDTPSGHGRRGRLQDMSKLSEASAASEVLARLQQAETELESLRRELDHSHQLATLGTLTAGIAHEINNILTPVLAYSQLAMANPGDEALRTKALDRAVAGVESASRIIEAVLGFARNDDQSEHAVVGEIIESSLACLSRDPVRDGIRLIIEVPADMAVRIRPLALQQVFLNLILNAISVLHGNQGELRLTAVELTDGTTRIRISDTGPGVPEEVRCRLFEPFVTTRKDGVPSGSGHGGSGLGLSVCKRLIENSGGSIILEDTPEGGASFAITLPTFLPSSDPKMAA